MKGTLQLQIYFFPILQVMAILLNKQKLTSANIDLHLLETGKYIVVYKKNI